MIQRSQGSKAARHAVQHTAVVEPPGANTPDDRGNSALASDAPGANTPDDRREPEQLKGGRGTTKDPLSAAPREAARTPPRSASHPSLAAAAGPVDRTGPHRRRSCGAPPRSPLHEARTNVLPKHVPTRSCRCDYCCCRGSTDRMMRSHSCSSVKAHAMATTRVEARG